MDYRERLTTPAWYWIVGVAVGVSSIAAMGLWFGPWATLIGAIVATAILTLAVMLLGQTEIQVGDEGLRVGRSLVEWEYVGRAEVLDAQRTHDRLGVDADARAFVTQRPWIPESVEVTIEDAADPHPYWLVSSRRPKHLVDAIRKAREAHLS